jgi:sugar lactone lactonase YvrE
MLNAGPAIVALVALTVAACTAAPAASPSAVAAGPSPSGAAATATAPLASATASLAATASPAPTVAYAPDHTGPVTAVGAHLDGAGGLAFDSAGNLYVAECDWTHAAVHRIDAHGMMTTYAGTGLPGFDGDASVPANAARLYCAADVKLGPDGALYIDDHLNNRIRRVDATGTMATYAGSGKAGFNLGSFSGDGGLATSATLQEPWAIAFDGAGNLFIADRDNNRIRKVDRQGIITTIAGNGEAGYGGDGVLGTKTSVNLPLGIAVDSQGNIFFASTADERIRKIDHETGIVTLVAGTGVGQSSGDGGPAIMASVADPEHLLFDADGNLYIEETAPLAFRRIDTNGRITTVSKIGSVPITPAQVPGFNGWMFGPDGDLYVATGSAVLKFGADGQMTVIAGTP